MLFDDSVVINLLEEECGDLICGVEDVLLSRYYPVYRVMNRPVDNYTYRYNVYKYNGNVYLLILKWAKQANMVKLLNLPYLLQGLALEEEKLSLVSSLVINGDIQGIDFSEKYLDWVNQLGKFHPKILGEDYYQSVEYWNRKYSSDRYKNRKGIKELEDSEYKFHEYDGSNYNNIVLLYNNWIQWKESNGEKIFNKYFFDKFLDILSYNDTIDGYRVFVVTKGKEVLMFAGYMVLDKAWRCDIMFGSYVDKNNPDKTELRSLSRFFDYNIMKILDGSNVDRVYHDFSLNDGIKRNKEDMSNGSVVYYTTGKIDKEMIWDGYNNSAGVTE